MTKTELARKLAKLDRRGTYLLTKQELVGLFPQEGGKAMEKSLQRMVAGGLLRRVAKGLYMNPATTHRSGWIMEEIAKALRPGCLSYVSLESILSEYGAISQIPLGCLTVMTTGRSGFCETQFGTIELTHTKRTRAEILKRTLAMDGRPLRVAREAAAIADLVRVGRNVHMLVDDD